MALMERMTIRGHDRIAEDHQTTGAKNDRAAADSGDEDRERMAGEQRVLGSVPAKRDGVIQ